MITQATIIDQVECWRDGTLGIRCKKQVLRDGKEINFGWHRAVLTPGADPEELLAGVNNCLKGMGEEPVRDEDWDRVRRLVPVEHTMDVIKAYEEKMAVAALAAAIGTGD